MELEHDWCCGESESSELFWDQEGAGKNTICPASRLMRFTGKQHATTFVSELKDLVIWFFTQHFNTLNAWNVALLILNQQITCVGSCRTSLAYVHYQLLEISLFSRHQMTAHRCKILKNLFVFPVGQWSCSLSVSFALLVVFASFLFVSFCPTDCKADLNFFNFICSNLVV